MATQLLPPEVAKDSLESYLGTSHRRRPIYAAMLAIVAGALLALPLIRIDVTVQAAGQLRPASEKNTVTAGSSGKVRDVYVTLRQHVSQGASLIAFETAPLEKEAQTLDSHLAAADRSIRDLTTLAALADRALNATAANRLPAAGPARYEDPSYAQQAAQFVAELDVARLQQDAARQGADRVRALRAKGFASDSAVITADQEAQRADANFRLTAARFHAQWQSELTQQALTRADLLSRHAQLSEQRERTVVTAPISGTVEELTSIAPGNFLQAGAPVAVISPDSGLFADIYVPTRDVGLIRLGMPVRLQIDAFQATEWGFVQASVMDIGSDFELFGQTAVFRVRCALARRNLRLNNGAIGTLKKGMTVRANFVVARRSAFQLLRDRLSDWVDPHNTPMKSPTAATEHPTTMQFVRSGGSDDRRWGIRAGDPFA